MEIGAGAFPTPTAKKITRAESIRCCSPALAARPCIHVKPFWLSPPQRYLIRVAVGWQWASSVSSKPHRRVDTSLQNVSNRASFYTQNGCSPAPKTTTQPTRAHSDAFSCPPKTLTANPRPPGRNTFVEVTAKKISREYMV